MSGSVVFVSGIDTGIGKTLVTGLMSRFLRLRGVDHATVKMVQTGCDGFSEDLLEHRAVAGLPCLPEDVEGLTAPQIFRFPASPSLAARLEGRAFDLRAAADAVAECARRRRLVLVEGAGGLLVPLGGSVMAADFAAARGWPLVLVTSGRLGAINHILLSLEAAAARGIRVVGVAMNAAPGTDPRIEADALDETEAALRRMGSGARVVRVPRVARDEAGGVAAGTPDIDFSPFFPEIFPEAAGAGPEATRP